MKGESPGGSCDVFDKVCFCRVKGSAIRVDDIVEPNFRDWIVFFGPPGIVGLGSSKDKAPIDCPHIVFLKHRQMSDKLGVHQSRHVFCADNRPIEFYLN